MVCKKSVLNLIKYLHAFTAFILVLFSLMCMILYVNTEIFVIKVCFGIIMFSLFGIFTYNVTVIPNVQAPIGLINFIVLSSLYSFTACFWWIFAFIKWIYFVNNYIEYLFLTISNTLFTILITCILVLINVYPLISANNKYVNSIKNNNKIICVDIEKFNN